MRNDVHVTGNENWFGPVQPGSPYLPKYISEN